MSAITFSIPSALAVSGTVTLSATTSALLRADANGVVSTTSLQANFSLAAGVLSLSSTLASINSITSVAGQNLVLACGTGGTALTFTTSTLGATFAGAVTASSITAAATTNLALAGGSSGASLTLGQGTAGKFYLSGKSADGGYSLQHYLGSGSDEVMVLGYNVGASGAFVVATEHQLYQGFESNYDNGGTPTMEWYVRFLSPQATGKTREPFFSNFNRSTNEIIETDIRGALIQLSNSSGSSAFLQLQASGATLNLPLTVVGNAITVGAGATFGDGVTINSTNGLTIAPGAATGYVVLNPTGNQNAGIQIKKNSTSQWLISNSGTAAVDFAISRYNDAGGFLATAFGIARASGDVSISSTTASTSATTGALVVSGGGAFATNLISGGGQGWGVTSTATAAGTTTLTTGSTSVQIFTGSTVQTVQLPAANAFGSGVAPVYTIINRSTQAITLQRAGSDLIEGGVTYSLPAGGRVVVMSDSSSAWLVI